MGAEQVPGGFPHAGLLLETRMYGAFRWSSRLHSLPLLLTMRLPKPVDPALPLTFTLADQQRSEPSLSAQPD
jgi:hypothetical protein